MKNQWIYVLMAGAACSLVSSNCFSDVLNITTDYRVRGLSYANTSFDLNSSSSTAYYSQRLSLGISADLKPDIEIGSKITALGIAGSSQTLNSLGVYPYAKTDFTPFIENAYVKVSKLADMPIDLTVGKQSLEYGDGLIVSDNGAGLFALKLHGYYNIPFPWEAEIFTAKVQEGVNTDTDENLIGFVGKIKYKRNLIELSYFQDDDKSGTTYTRGINTIGTTEILKKFYDLRFGRSEKAMGYQFEAAEEKGFVSETDNANTNINFDGYCYRASGRLTGDHTKLGKVTAYALFSVASGNTKPSSLTDDDNQFSSNLTKKFDGLERAGYGQLFSATTADSFFPIPADYSGIDTLNVGTDFSPIYGWDFIIAYFLFSASQGPAGAPEASGFEKIFGADFTLGIELDLAAKYAYSKNVDFKLCYDRYTPPNYTLFWPNQTPATLYELEVDTRF
jgi:hypothetical protein